VGRDVVGSPTIRKPSKRGAASRELGFWDVCGFQWRGGSPQPQSSQPFGQGSPSSQLGPSSQSKPHHHAHQFAPVRGAVPAGAAQYPPWRGGRVGPVVPNPGDGRGGGMLDLEAALVLELGFPLSLGLGLAPGIGPNLYPSIQWWRQWRINHPLGPLGPTLFGGPTRADGMGCPRQ
jgi:hypothetical protein